MTAVRKLEVKSFSCIEHAALEIAELTVIIGPQASGKSVLCKLFYFFSTALTQMPRWLIDEAGIDTISTRILEEFSELFQPSSWGKKAFSITYTDGPYEISISRSRSRTNSGKAKVALSDAITDLIEKAQAAFTRITTKSDASREPIEVSWRVQEAVTQLFDKALGKYAPEEQLYIPAGRSFFTSIGKIVTAFDDRSMLDPVVTRFGRLITSIREHSFLNTFPSSPLLKTIERLIDGEVVNEKGKQFLSTTDGRSVPFSALSSGQQELLPLLHALRFSVAYPRQKPSLLYIEEPEAHLFPSAQTALVEMFAQLTNAKPAGPKSRTTRLKIILTTHSPYVLAKINNLIKAGSLANKLSADKRKELDKIIPSSAWLDPSRVAAYAISERRLVKIVDEYGLIDGDYIDDVSATTGMEFENMLEMEANLD